MGKCKEKGKRKKECRKNGSAEKWIVGKSTFTLIRRIRWAYTVEIGQRIYTHEIAIEVVNTDFFPPEEWEQRHAGVAFMGLSGETAIWVENTTKNAPVQQKTHFDELIRASIVKEKRYVNDVAH